MFYKTVVVFFLICITVTVSIYKKQQTETTRAKSLFKTKKRQITYTLISKS